MRTLKQPIKVIDNFFEAPMLWREFALKQDYFKDQYFSWPGIRSKPLNEINFDLFQTFASALMNHMHDKQGFAHLKVNFALVDGSYNLGWLHLDEPHYNVAGVIYLNKEAKIGTGTSFYNRVLDSGESFSNYFFEELNSNEDKTKFISIKERQRSSFKRTMTVENVFNRCVMFPPEVWHGVDSYFGSTKEDSRLTITFFGRAV